jgi:glycosyltransferase involved in cell wall biosynthesis
MRKSIIYLGSNGFPLGMAQMQRQLNISKALLQAGFKVTVCCRKGVSIKQTIKENVVQRKGIFEGVFYVYTSLTPYYHENGFIRNLLKIIGFFGEILFIVKSRIIDNVRYLLINTLSLNQLKYYYILSKLLNLTIIYDYVEFIGSLSSQRNINKKFDNYFMRYCHKIIYISDFLKNNIIRIDKSIPLLKIPPITDFHNFNAVEVNALLQKPYFLFCGSAAYLDVIKFIIDSYICTSTKRIELLIISSGLSSQVDELDEYISQKDKQIKRISDISYQQLISYYKNSKALLIPLRENNLQDHARFPHKISEYTAAGVPIITNNSHEINNYFTDMDNALIAKSYCEREFAKKMDFVCNHPIESINIGQCGRKIGNKYFNYKNYSESLEIFLT